MSNEHIIKTYQIVKENATIRCKLFLINNYTSHIYDPKWFENQWELDQLGHQNFVVPLINVMMEKTWSSGRYIFGG